MTSSSPKLLSPQLLEFDLISAKKGSRSTLADVYMGQSNTDGVGRLTEGEKFKAAIGSDSPELSQMILKLFEYEDYTQPGSKDGPVTMLLKTLIMTGIQHNTIPNVTAGHDAMTAVRNYFTHIITEQFKTISLADKTEYQKLEKPNREMKDEKVPDLTHLRDEFSFQEGNSKNAKKAVTDLERNLQQIAEVEKTPLSVLEAKRDDLTKRIRAIVSEKQKNQMAALPLTRELESINQQIAYKKKPNAKEDTEAELITAKADLIKTQTDREKAYNDLINKQKETQVYKKINAMLKNIEKLCELVAQHGSRLFAIPIIVNPKAIFTSGVKSALDKIPDQKGNVTNLENNLANLKNNLLNGYMAAINEYLGGLKDAKPNPTEVTALLKPYERLHALIANCIPILQYNATNPEKLKAIAEIIQCINEAIQPPIINPALRHAILGEKLENIHAKVFANELQNKGESRAKGSDFLNFIQQALLKDKEFQYPTIMRNLNLPKDIAPAYAEKIKDNLHRLWKEHANAIMTAKDLSEESKQKALENLSSDFKRLCDITVDMLNIRTNYNSKAVMRKKVEFTQTEAGKPAQAADANVKIIAQIEERIGGLIAHALQDSKDNDNKKEEPGKTYNKLVELLNGIQKIQGTHTDLVESVKPLAKHQAVAKPSFYADLPKIAAPAAAAPDPKPQQPPRIG